MSEIELDCNQLSAEGVRSDEYIRWKEETLANQTSHKVNRTPIKVFRQENSKAKLRLN